MQHNTPQLQTSNTANSIYKLVCCKKLRTQSIVPQAWTLAKIISATNTNNYAALNVYGLLSSMIGGTKFIADATNHNSLKHAYAMSILRTLATNIVNIHPERYVISYGIHTFF